MNICVLHLQYELKINKFVWSKKIIINFFKSIVKDTQFSGCTYNINLKKIHVISSHLMHQLILWHRKFAYKIFKIDIVFMKANGTCFSIKISNFSK